MTTAASHTSPSTSPGPAATPRPRANIEVMILSYNEEANLPHALKSVVDWADAVYVVDSQSKDRTREIAESMGAKVVVQPWLGYARQKNWALANLPFQADWVFILDADESITPELRDELLAIAAQPAEHIAQAGFYVNRLTYFMGKPIRRCGYFPSYNLRFFKRGRARYEEREVHEHMVVDGSTAQLRHIMHHEDRRGLEHFIAKHNRYSTLEARELTRARAKGGGQQPRRLERGIAIRRWLKHNVLPKLPLSGVSRFIYMYFLRLGFLDGVAGFRFCLLLATYDMFISLKLAEIKALGADRDPALLGAAPPALGLAIPEGEVNSAAAAAQGRASVAPVPPPSAPAPSAAPASNGVAKSPSAPTLPPPRPVPAPPAEPGARPQPDPRSPLVEKLAAQVDRDRPPPGRWPAPRSVPVSVLVPVKNEQRNIVECLRHLQWADEIVVVDSQSTDQTIPLAQAMGADVYQFYYSKEGWPKKKNWALEQVPWRNEWVLILDADEFMTPELAEEIRQVVTGQYKPRDPRKAGCGDGYWLNRRFMFMGRWIKGCGYYPSYNVRLFKHKVGRYERIGTLGDTGSGDNEVHEHVTLATGEAGYLEHEFLHYAYPDLSAWIEKHNRYTTWEAHAMEAKDEGAVRASLFGEPIERRRWMKRMARHLPFRPTLRFFFSYFVQRGFLDGYPGFVMCRLLSWYEFVSLAKYRERRMRT